MNTKKSTPRPFIVKKKNVGKTKEKSKKAAGEEWLSCTENLGKINRLLLLETAETRGRVVDGIFKVLKEKKKKHQPRILYPAKMSLRNEGKIKIFSMEKVSEKKPQRIGGQQTHRTENIKGLLWAESKWPQMILQIHMRKTESAKLFNYMRQRKCVYLSFLNWLLKTSF